MKKFYINDEKDLNEEEKRTGKVSYGRIVSRYINNMILCNNINDIDYSIWDNLQVELDDDDEIYQYYLCDIDNYEKNILIEWGFIFSYSDMLDLDVLMVNHFGTSWDYVMTDVEWTENYDECN